MKILAIDTAASICAVAIYDTDSAAVLAAISEDIGKGHAEVLMDFIARALVEADLDMDGIDRIAVNIGPGSFTGVRIGVSAARGFALALDRPAIGISAFAAIAAETGSAFAGRPVLVLLDAHRGEIYAQSFDAAGKALTRPLVLTHDEAVALCAAQDETTVLAGSAAAAINAALENRFALGEAKATGAIATYAWLAADIAPDEAPKPLYMRGPDAKPQVGFALPRQQGGE
ncbi:tRNA (adenosine(37)-N6)-threonylcarbamoyltransferase complex dimerization subunit type 1 TsaB [Daeguia caeni]|uniref:tRNA (Adenosine(37)-N6)-threonylcarbamoyltransferase complex dimerization subunit type 1 TsaB n=1 Tax=Daeguia caeni TaxID=439612 RepID=A0ABV9HAU1_9HYPH